MCVQSLTAVEVVFIATANSLRPIFRPLLDRMEIISIPGYTVLEKQEIARQHLLPRQMGLHDLNITV